GHLLGTTEKEVRETRRKLGLKPVYKLVDTCAAEFEAETPYYYSTWQGEDEVVTSDRPKILVVGSGPIRIGQGIEFDYCSVHAALSVKKLGYEAVVINNNPETVSTDFATADRLYFDPLTLEDLLNVIEKEKILGVLIQFGGQTAINLAAQLEEEGIKLLGPTAKTIDNLEDRELFYNVLHELEIPHIQGEMVPNPEELKQAAERLGFPILIRPSYVIGGQSMFIFYDQKELGRAIETNLHSGLWPLLVDRYLPGLEFEVDAVSDGEEMVVPGLFEHIEKAGIHSGDSVAVFPPVSVPKAVQQLAVDYTKKLCKACHIIGLINIQFVFANDILYVLEVNPRASRTVPIISKVTGFPLVDTAVAVQLGKKLRDVTNEKEWMTPPAFYSVKAPVFSSVKLNGVDPVLGPELKSTGEALGLGETLEEAFEKALFLGKGNPFKSTEKASKLLCSISLREQGESLPLLKHLQDKGFELVATPQTARFLVQNGVAVTQTVTTFEEIKTLFEAKTVSAVINCPTNGRNRTTFGFQLRAEAIKCQVPVFTCLDTVKAALTLQLTSDQIKVKTLVDYRQDSKKGSGLHV
ncbi:MAG TPA: carbamoyl-phosphate synthase large subunit, partial [Candidatus Angelobacter sp.]|nr:carbamoyl-phosphate synthase large subunit [Candidatus Angelobacter sp.]